MPLKIVRNTILQMEVDADYYMEKSQKRCNRKMSIYLY